MTINLSSHWKAVLQALLVTFLWSTSWVLIKIGLEDIPSLTFAGLRYMLAFLCLLPLVLRKPYRSQIKKLSRRDWAFLLLLGALLYGVTQGSQFAGLFYLPAITVSLMLNFTSILVALMGIVFLTERLTVLQWMGTALFILGILIYFYPIIIPQSQVLGLLIVTVGVVANAISSIMGRGINRSGQIHPLVITCISMGIGAVLLLAAGISIQGLPPLRLQHWIIIAWLAVINTAFAFTLWNHTLRTLSAVESSLINNTMTVQIAILAWIFLGENLNLQQLIGMILAVIGIFIVQMSGISLSSILAAFNRQKALPYDHQDESPA
ncbi:MAG: EamA family transporter [Chloroflexi bacterium]|nr:EamA family transporter [Chloroflexota bacterium]